MRQIVFIKYFGCATWLKIKDSLFIVVRNSEIWNFLYENVPWDSIKGSIYVDFKMHGSMERSFYYLRLLIIFWEIEVRVVVDNWDYLNPCWKSKECVKNYINLWMSFYVSFHRMEEGRMICMRKVCFSLSLVLGSVLWLLFHELFFKILVRKVMKDGQKNDISIGWKWLESLYLV